MRKNVFGRKLKRDKNERKALFKSLMSALVLEGRIKTTEAKAKSIKGQIEKLITKAKKQTDSFYGNFQLYLSPSAVKKLVAEVAPSFAARQGGYTRIIRLNRRFADNASMVLIEFTEMLKVQLATPAMITSGSESKDLDKKTAGKKDEKEQKKIVVKKSVRRTKEKEVKKKDKKSK